MPLRPAARRNTHRCAFLLQWYWLFEFVLALNVKLINLFVAAVEFAAFSYCRKAASKVNRTIFEMSMTRWFFLGVCFSFQRQPNGLSCRRERIPKGGIGLWACLISPRPFLQASSFCQIHNQGPRSGSSSYVIHAEERRCRFSCAFDNHVISWNASDNMEWNIESRNFVCRRNVQLFVEKGMRNIDRYKCVGTRIFK